jgi:hypothetical protein
MIRVLFIEKRVLNLFLDEKITLIEENLDGNDMELIKAKTLSLIKIIVISFKIS